LVAAIVSTSDQAASAQRGAGVAVIAPQSLSELRSWDVTTTALMRDGELRLRQQRSDVLTAGRHHERYDQYYNGVRVFGSDVARQTDGAVTISLFGQLHYGIELDTNPTLSAEEARAHIHGHAGAETGEARQPALVVLPRPDGGYSLAYEMRVFGPEGLHEYFVDAHTGALLWKYSDLKTEAALGVGTGVLGDTKKLSIEKSGTTHRTQDLMRPPSLRTFDMRGNLTRTIGYLNGVLALTPSDLASAANNVWQDGAVVDAHAYAGYVYDYLYKRFGRRGLDNKDIPIVSIVHPVNQRDVMRQTPAVVGTFYMNAFYAGDGIMVYGEGLPDGFVDTTGRAWSFLSGALDVVAHELTHGVTDYSSQLVYQNESGALNEAFSDIVAASAEFFFQPVGDGPAQADWLIGEDMIRPGGLRSLANPSSFGDPDHYSVRFRGTADNGGVHINSSIPNHAFYLAVAGGPHRLSRVVVEGVGLENLEQMERVFYRAFTEMMPSNANFAMARAITIQSARDLYGTGSAAERALIQAWTAVGVQ
jgi:bacillolysin